MTHIASFWVGQMFQQGFRNFVGVDGSEAMLLEAKKTCYYRNLELAILGRDTLPVQTGNISDACNFNLGP